MNELIAAVQCRAVRFKDPVYGPNGAQIAAFIQQSGMNRGGRAILEAFGIQDVMQPILLPELSARGDVDRTTGTGIDSAPGGPNSGRRL